MRTILNRKLLVPKYKKPQLIIVIRDEWLNFNDSKLLVMFLKCLEANYNKKLRNMRID